MDQGIQVIKAAINDIFEAYPAFKSKGDKAQIASLRENQFVVYNGEPPLYKFFQKDEIPDNVFYAIMAEGQLAKKGGQLSDTFYAFFRKEITNNITNVDFYDDDLNTIFPVFSKTVVKDVFRADFYLFRETNLPTSVF